MKTDA